MKKKFAFVAVMMPVLSVVADLDPVGTRWTFGADASKRTLPADGSLPTFVEYLLMVVK